MKARRFTAIVPLLLFAFTTSVASQQLSTQSTASIILFNMGVQEDATLVPDGERDPHYTLILSRDPTFQGPNTYTLLDPNAYPLGLWPTNTSISKWIAPSPNNLAGYWGGNALAGCPQTAAQDKGATQAKQQGTATKSVPKRIAQISAFWIGAWPG